ncbi:hypothetical protein ABZ721_05620 [Streptomyces sp. NPDC006733]|uniref:hypothetical protein n=1 Tax=Streptomyces sp. NPDC006733 TaxID=3155460 RepID=UPI00340E843B
MGVIERVEHSPGAGVVLEVRISGNDGLPPVRVAAAEAFDVEVDYLPVSAHDPIRMTVTAETDHGEQTVACADVGRVPLPGVASVAVHRVVLPPALADQDVTLRIELGSGGLTEACVRLAAHVTAAAAQN